jgi:hypothetical protein
MHGISSDDRLWMIERDHADRRALAAAERISKPVPATPGSLRTSPEAIRVVHAHRPFGSAPRLLDGIAGMRLAFHAHAGR